MNDLALLTAAERSRLVEEFIDDTFGERHDPFGIGERIREATHALPTIHTRTVDAWFEVAGLVQDPGFRQRVRQMAEAGAGSGEQVDAESGQQFAARSAELDGPAAAGGLDPASEDAERIVDRLLPEVSPGSGDSKELPG